MFGSFVIFTVTAILAYWIWWRKNKLALRDRLGIPGPKPSFVAGNLDIMKVSDEERLKLTTKLREQYGDYYGIYSGPKLTIMLHDLDMIKEVLIKQFSSFTDRRYFPLKDPEAVSAQGLVDLRGERWKRVRNAVTPVFSSGKLKQMAQIMDEKNDIFLKKMEANATSGSVFDMYKAFQALTLDVIGRAAFAFDTDCQRDSNDQFLVRCTEFFNKIDLRSNVFIKFVVLLPELPIWSRLRFMVPFAKAEAWLIHQLDGVIARRRETFETFKGMDVMQIMLQQQKEERERAMELVGCPFANQIEPQETARMTDAVILSNALVFLLAGYETTSTALGFTAYCLATHEDVQKRLQQEIDDKLKEKGKSKLDYDEVMKEMPYLDAVFHESLRLYPPVHGFVARTCVTPCIVKGVRFEPGMVAMIPVYSIHRDPELWAEPEKFNPDRFVDNTTYNPMAWLPFGGGPRNCIGLRFAELEYKTALSQLLAKYTIVPSFDTNEKMKLENTGVLMRPKGGVKVTLETRS